MFFPSTPPSSEEGAKGTTQRNTHERRLDQTRVKEMLGPLVVSYLIAQSLSKKERCLMSDFSNPVEIHLANEVRSKTSGIQLYKY